MFVVYPTLVIVGAVTCGAGIVSALLREEFDGRPAIVGLSGKLMVVSGLTVSAMTVRDAVRQMAILTGAVDQLNSVPGTNPMVDAIDGELAISVPMIDF